MSNLKMQQTESFSIIKNQMLYLTELKFKPFLNHHMFEYGKIIKEDLRIGEKSIIQWGIKYSSCVRKSLIDEKW